MNQSQPSQQKPIIVTIDRPNQQNKDLQGLSDVLLGSLGVTGILILGALVLGVLMASVMFWMRSNKPFDH
jgi:hypothetical protein